MKMFKIIAVAATLAMGASAVYAGPFDSSNDLSSISALDTATFATVLTVNSNEALTLSLNNDIASVQARIMNNPYLARTLANQGFTIDQVVAVDGTTTNLTIYAL